jgi:2-amino-4-hydroxy-6-hydroxymethyldihydropteridine diphosphokinase
MQRVYLALGSNLGDRAAHLRDALHGLNAAGVRVLRVSSVYETEPQDFRIQPWFLNVVAECETALFPAQLLGRIQALERELGRRRGTLKGPRVIDIDILFYGRQRIRTRRLVVPHPRLARRRFVLEPLAELDPTLPHPATGATVREMLGNVRRQRLRKLSQLQL